MFITFYIAITLESTVHLATIEMNPQQCGYAFRSITFRYIYFSNNVSLFTSWLQWVTLLFG